MSTAPPDPIKPPGFLWIVWLGGAGFAAGFFGPMVFIPEPNLGPIVGIFFSGPGGALLGLVMFLLMKVLPVRARRQWTLLIVLGVAGVLATLAIVQPEPATRGYEFEIAVERSEPAGSSANAVVADWKSRIAHVTWATPRAGWEEQMRAALAADPGLVIEAMLLRERAIKEHRKPWNRGRLFTTAWQAVQEKCQYYVRDVDRALAGGAAPVRVFLLRESTAPIRAPEIWPPADPEQFIGYSRLQRVPPAYAGLP